jgi:hypothetical protein
MGKHIFPIYFLTLFGFNYIVLATADSFNKASSSEGSLLPSVQGCNARPQPAGIGVSYPGHPFLFADDPIL